MSIGTNNEALIILNVAPAIEEAIVDWLLENNQDSGFTIFPVRGYSTSHENLSIGEQVSGRQRRLQVQVQMKSSVVDEFLAGLATSLGDAGIHYWVLPILRGGHFGVSA